MSVGLKKSSIYFFENSFLFVSDVLYLLYDTISSSRRVFLLVFLLSAVLYLVLL